MKAKFFQIVFLLMILKPDLGFSQTKKPVCDNDVYADRYNSDARRNMTLDSACAAINKGQFTRAYIHLCTVAYMDSMATGEPDALVDQQRRKILNYIENNPEEGAAAGAGNTTEPEQGTLAESKTENSNAKEQEAKAEKESKKAQEQESKAQKEKEAQDKKALKEQEEQEKKANKEKADLDKKAQEQESKAQKEKEAQEKKALKEQEEQEKKANKEKSDQDKKASKGKKEKKSDKSDSATAKEDTDKPTASEGEKKDENNTGNGEQTTAENETPVAKENEPAPVEQNDEPATKPVEQEPLKAEPEGGMTEAEIEPPIPPVDLKFSEEEVAQFQDKGLQKIKLLEGYIKQVSSKTTSGSLAMDATENAILLFDNEDRFVEVSSINSGAKARFKIRKYLERLRMLNFDEVDITWADFQYTSDFIKGPDGNYHGYIIFRQRFTATKDNQVVYEDVTTKKTEVILKFYSKAVAGVETENWDVLLGDISVEQTEKK